MTYQFDRETAKDAAEAALEAVKYRLEDDNTVVTLSKLQYGNECKITLTLTRVEIGESGVNEASPAAIAYRRWHDTFGLRADALGVEFTQLGVAYQFTGIASNRPKYPFNAVRLSNGKTYKFPVAATAAINAAAAKRAGE
jgi:hypothetical protein